MVQVDLLVDPADGLVMDDVERASGLVLPTTPARPSAAATVLPVRGEAFAGERGARTGRPSGVELGAGGAPFQRLDITSGFTVTVERGTELSVGGARCAWSSSRRQSATTGVFL
ncbi:MAG: hypothetical protein ACLR3C_10370 [Eggerthella lenta]